MRDSLLDRDNACLATVQRRCETARIEAQRLADAGTVVSRMGEWCRETLFNSSLLGTGNNGHDLSYLLTLPADHSPMRVLQRIPGATRRPLEEGFTALLEGRENDLRDTLAWLFGQALAKGLVDKLADGNEPANLLLSRLLRLIGPEEVLRCAFEESFQERLHNSQSARSTILSALETRVRDINDDPGSYTNERSALNAFVAEWRSNSSIEKVWNPSPLAEAFRISCGLLSMVPCILPTDRIAVLNCLNRFDFPNPIRQFLQRPAILHDRDEIAAILKAAPTCSEDGRSWNGSLLVLLALQTAGAHCHALWGATYQAANSDDTNSELRETVAVTLSSWLEELGRIVMDRPDGQFLGPQWLFMKAANERRGRAHHGYPSDLIEWIALGLFKAGLTSREIAAPVDFPEVPTDGNLAPARSMPRDPAQTQPRLEALSMMALVHRIGGNTPATDGQKLLDRLDALLASRDSGFETEFSRLSVHGSLLYGSPNSGTLGLPAFCFGHVLANADEPAERWRQSWDFLGEQRRRAQHCIQTDNSDALAPSVFLLSVGTAGIGPLLSSDSHFKARRLWRALFDGTRDCWLTTSLTHLRTHFNDPIETHLGQLFAQHPKVFGDSTGQVGASEPDTGQDMSSYSELLAADLDFLGGDDLMVTVCILNAHYNGATPSTIDKVLKRNTGHFDGILRQFERWQQLELQVRRRTGIVDALADLRSKLQ